MFAFGTDPSISLYTLYVTSDSTDTPPEDMFYDELDIRTSARASLAEVMSSARVALYTYPGCRVIGVVDQSAGEILFQDFAGNALTS